MKCYERLTPKKLSETKEKAKNDETFMTAALTLCWAFETARESGELCDREEVRKETAREILQTLYRQTHNYYPSIDSYCVSKKVILVKDLEDVCKEYGVGLEEQQ